MCFGLVSELMLWWLKDAVSTQGEAIDLQQVFLVFWCSVFELSVMRSLAAVLLCCVTGTLWSRLAGFHGDGVQRRVEELWCAWGRLLGDGGDGGAGMLSFGLI